MRVILNRVWSPCPGKFCWVRSIVYSWLVNSIFKIILILHGSAWKTVWTNSLLLPSLDELLCRNKALITSIQDLWKTHTLNQLWSWYTAIWCGALKSDHSNILPVSQGIRWWGLNANLANNAQILVMSIKPIQTLKNTKP